MKTADVSRLARAAGIQGMLTDVVCEFSELERFAALVEAEVHKEIEAGVANLDCAHLCGIGTDIVNAIRATSTQPAPTGAQLKEPQNG